jgi:IS30 family transposase
MRFRQSSDIVLIVHERTSRRTKIIRQPSRSALITRDSLARLFAAKPAPPRRALTIDNGATEKVSQAYNETPRKCLGYRTPNEAFSEIIERVALET